MNTHKPALTPPTVSENKVLCHPASIDSLTTSAGTEDHVSMGGFAARKALMVSLCVCVCVFVILYYQ